MNIAVIGVSGISSVVTGYLKTLHTNVKLINIPSSNNVEGELTVRGTNLPIAPPISLSTIHELEGFYDFILIFSTPDQNDRVLPYLKPHLKETTIILSFQLTLSDEKLIQAFPSNPVISAICHFNASYRANDVVFLTTNVNTLEYHGFDISSNNRQYSNELLEAKNFLDFIAQTNIIGATKNLKWSYALYIITFDRLASSLNCSYGDILHHKIAFKIAIHLADEVARIATKHQIELVTFDEINLNELVIDSDTKIEEIGEMFKTFLQSHLASESYFKYNDDYPRDIIDELIYYARKVDQPTPYMDLLSHCLHFSQQAPFHENIQIFEPLVKGAAI